MKVQLVSFERELKQLEKSLLLYAFILYPVKISVCVASKIEKKGKDEIICVERLSSITFEKTLIKNVETKPAFFS